MEMTHSTYLVKIWPGRRVSVGKPKLCHRTALWLLCSRSTRLPVSNKCSSSVFEESVLVDQTSNCPASVKTRFPVLRSESVDRFPLTGWSRFAIHTTVFVVACVENHIAKEYAFSPTGLNPAVKVPFGDETMTSSSGFSTERGREEERWKWKRKKMRRKGIKVGEDAMFAFIWREREIEICDKLYYLYSIAWYGEKSH